MSMTEEESMSQTSPSIFPPTSRVDANQKTYLLLLCPGFIRIEGRELGLLDLT